jgi:transcriptional regulator with XRE-family HTH domain
MATIEREVRAANETLDWARELLGLEWSEVAAAVGADRRTIYRWRHGVSAPSPEHRERIEDIRELRFLLETVFPDPEARLGWLHASVPFLRGRSPLSLIRRGRLADVIGVLAGIESGAFA